MKRQILGVPGNPEIWLVGLSDTEEPGFAGHSMYRGNYYSWTALPTPKGFQVVIWDDKSRRTEQLSATWNLGLEVAWAIKKADQHYVLHNRR